MNPLSFSSLPLTPILLDNLQSLEFDSMTPIQAQSLPLILAGKDVIGKAKTGSGKTAAFGLGILTKLDVESLQTQALVVCPTRELADQVAKEIRRLARTMNNIKVLTLCGGMPMMPQVISLEHGAHIIVGTPGRIINHLERESLDLSRVNMLVLDEADRMLDMGFEDEINNLLTFIPKPRQTLLFSATYPDTIVKMSRRVQQNPESVSIDEANNEIEQRFYEIDKDQRNLALAKVLTNNPCESTLVFCNTKIACQEVETYLRELGFAVVTLNGDLEQRERTQVLIKFTNKSASILVATDVAARGLDIKELELVVNYQITPDPEVHVHRIGRTGRAGVKGLAITLVAPNEAPRANMIETYQNTKINWLSLDNLTINHSNIIQPQMQTLCLDMGRKNKMRPGDILGALIKDAGLDNSDIGKIDITEWNSYIAINRKVIKKALAYIREGKIKGKTLRAHIR